MPIREIFNYIRERRSKFSKEEIIQQLSEKGYAEDEIEEAFLLDQGRPGAAPYLEKSSAEKQSQSLPQTIWAAIKQRQSVEPQIPPKSSWVDLDKAWRIALIFGGFLAVPVLYYLAVLSLFFLQLFSTVPQVDPLVLLAGAILVSLTAGIILKSKNTGFTRGIFWSVGVFLVVLIIQVFKSDLNPWPIHLFK